MNSKESIQIQVQSRLPMRRPSDFLGMVRCQVENLPEYMPTKYDWREPIRQIFYPQLIEHVIPPNWSSADTTDWIRTGKDRARGSWRTRTDFSLDCGTKHSHAGVYFQTRTTKHQAALLRFLKAMGRSIKTNFGYCDAQTTRYLPFGLDNGWIYGNMYLATHILRHWLPDMPWASVWGLDYIDLFGKERLLSAPAYKTELLADDVVFVQLTPDLNDLWDNFDEVMQAREKAKQYLGYDCFWQKEKGYEWRDHPEKAGKVFRVPDFKFIEDGFPNPYSSITLTQTEDRLDRKAQKRGGVIPAIVAEVEKLIAKGCDEVDSKTITKLETSYQWHIRSVENKKKIAIIKAERAEKEAQVRAMIEQKS